MDLPASREKMRAVIDLLRGRARREEIRKVVEQAIELLPAATLENRIARGEAHAALAYVLGLVSAGNGPLDHEAQEELVTRLQNAIDGLPTQLGGEPLLPT